MENNLISLQTQIDFKNKQIKNLQNKLDSQDIIIQDYYSIKDKYAQSQIEISNLKKNLQNLNLIMPSISNQLNQKDTENQKLKNTNMQLSKELNDLKMTSNLFHTSQNKLEKELKEYKKHELLFKNLQIENEILNAKILNLNDIENKSEKVIEDLKDMNKKLNIEKDDIIKEKNEYEITITDSSYDYFLYKKSATENTISCLLIIIINDIDIKLINKNYLEVKEEKININNQEKIINQIKNQFMTI